MSQGRLGTVPTSVDCFFYLRAYLSGSPSSPLTVSSLAARTLWSCLAHCSHSINICGSKLNLHPLLTTSTFLCQHLQSFWGCFQTKLPPLDLKACIEFFLKCFEYFLDLLTKYSEHDITFPLCPLCVYSLTHESGCSKGDLKWFKSEFFLLHVMMQE